MCISIKLLMCLKVSPLIFFSEEKFYIQFSFSFLKHMNVKQIHVYNSHFVYLNIKKLSFNTAMHWIVGYVILKIAFVKLFLTQ